MQGAHEPRSQNALSYDIFFFLRETVQPVLFIAERSTIFGLEAHLTENVAVDLTTGGREGGSHGIHVLCSAWRWPKFEVSPLSHYRPILLTDPPRS